MKKTNLVYKKKPIYTFDLWDRILMAFYPMQTQVTSDGILKYKKRNGKFYLYDLEVKEKGEKVE